MSGCPLSPQLITIFPHPFPAPSASDKLWEMGPRKIWYPWPWQNDKARLGAMRTAMFSNPMRPVANRSGPCRYKDLRASPERFDIGHVDDMVWLWLSLNVASLNKRSPRPPDSNTAEDRLGHRGYLTSRWSPGEIGGHRHYDAHINDH